MCKINGERFGGMFVNQAFPATIFNPPRYRKLTFD